MIQLGQCSASAHASFAVYAVDEFSGGESLVSALLESPFSPEVESVRISKRWEGREQDSRLDIEYGVYSMCSPIIGSDHFADMPHLPSRILKATQKAHHLHHRTLYVYLPRFWHLCPCLYA